MMDTDCDVEQLLRDIHYQLVRLSRSTLQELGLTPPRFHTLALVVANGPLTMSEVHDLLHVSKSTVTALVDGLVSDGFIERGTFEGDRRKIVLSATPSGKGVLEAVREHRCRLVEGSMDGLPGEARDCLGRALSHMKQRLVEEEA